MGSKTAEKPKRSYMYGSDLHDDEFDIPRSDDDSDGSVTGPVPAESVGGRRKFKPQRNEEARKNPDSVRVFPPPQQNVSLTDDWEDDPPPYGTLTVAVAQPQDNLIGFKKEYVFSVPGALRLLEIVLSLIGFIATLAGNLVMSGFVIWVTSSAFIMTTLLFIIMAFNINKRLPEYYPLIELIYLMLYDLKYLIATIIAAVGASRSPSIIVACVVCAVAMIIFLLDTVMKYQRLRALRLEQANKRAAGEGPSNKQTDNASHVCIIF